MASFNETLIKLVKKHRILYDSMHHNFRNLKKKDQIWKQIGFKMNESGVRVKKRWKNLRDTYTRHLKTIRKSGFKKKVKWQWAEQMEVFRPFVAAERAAAAAAAADDASELDENNYETNWEMYEDANGGDDMLQPLILNPLEDYSSTANGQLVPVPQDLNECSSVISETPPALTATAATPGTSGPRTRSKSVKDDSKVVNVSSTPGISDFSNDYGPVYSYAVDNSYEYNGIPNIVDDEQPYHHNPQVAIDYDAPVIVDYKSVKSAETDKTGRQLDATELLFLAHARSVKMFSAKRQAITKMKIAQVIMQQELLHQEELSKSQHRYRNVSFTPESECSYGYYYSDGQGYNSMNQGGGSPYSSIHEHEAYAQMNPSMGHGMDAEDMTDDESVPLSVLKGQSKITKFFKNSA